MPNCYTRIERNLAAVGGARTIWRLGFPTRALIRSVRIEQTGAAVGPDVTFRANLYNSKRIVGDSLSSGGADADGDYSASAYMYRMNETDMESQRAGRLYSQFTHWLVFENKDGSGPATRERYIYVEMLPDGSGDQTYDIAIDIVTD